MKPKYLLALTLSITFGTLTGALSQSFSGDRPVGSCPDASLEEAQEMGFVIVPIEMPSFVRRDGISATAVEAVIDAHKVETFARIEDTFRLFLEQLPTIQEQIAPKKDVDIFGSEATDDVVNTPSDPFFAFCYSFSESSWSFSPGVEVASSLDQLSLDGRSPIAIPPQTYAVFKYDGPRADIANFRYSLTSTFWPISKVLRTDSPNFEVYPMGDDGESTNVQLQLWVAVDPSTIPDGVSVSEY